MRRIVHTLALIALTAALLVLPYRLFVGPLSGLGAALSGTDAVSSASVILDSPSGEYVALLNTDRHARRGTSGQWVEFLQGESLVIMDDISCMAAKGDAGGIELAQSLRSRLPENQMTLTLDEPALVLSRAEYDMFDLIIMSAEFADAYSAGRIYDHAPVEVVLVQS